MLDFLSTLISLLTQHTIFSYSILFITSLLDSLFPVSPFIYGEFFFLSGAIFAGNNILNIWIVSSVLITGNILGSSLSYFLGKYYGIQIQKNIEHNFLFARFQRKKKLQKAQKFFKKYAALSFFLSGFFGICRWGMPFIGGMSGISYRKFLLFHIPGSVGGISIYIISGYFLGNHLISILHDILLYTSFIFFVGVSSIISYYYFKKYINTAKNRKKISQKKKYFIRLFAQHIFLYTFIIVMIYALFLYSLFFIFEKRYRVGDAMNFEHQLLSVSDIQEKSSLITFFPHSDTPIQTVNYVIITEKAIEEIMIDLGWIENISFENSVIHARDFLRLFQEKQLPVSTLLLNNAPQNSAFQLPSKYVNKRTHIRFWNYGKYKNKNVYLGSISDDSELKLAFYNYFLTPIHEVEANIDIPRNILYNHLKEAYPKLQKEERLWLRDSKISQEDILTDGYVYIITL